MQRKRAGGGDRSSEGTRTAAGRKGWWSRASSAPRGSVRTTRATGSGGRRDQGRAGRGISRAGRCEVPSSWSHWPPTSWPAILLRRVGTPSASPASPTGRRVTRTIAAGGGRPALRLAEDAGGLRRADSLGVNQYGRQLPVWFTSGCTTSTASRGPTPKRRWGRGDAQRRRVEGDDIPQGAACVSRGSADDMEGIMRRAPPRPCYSSTARAPAPTCRV